MLQLTDILVHMALRKSSNKPSGKVISDQDVAVGALDTDTLKDLMDDSLKKIFYGGLDARLKKSKESKESRKGGDDGAGKLLEGYGEVEIISGSQDVLPLYRIKMPELNNEEKALLERSKEMAIEEIKIDLDKIADPAERKRLFNREVQIIIKRESKLKHLDANRLNQLCDMAVRDMLGYGRLDPMLADDRLEDILVTGAGKPVYVYHSKYGMCSTNVIFNHANSIKYLIDKMARAVGRRIDQQTPLLDARLPDGSRVNATIPPVTLGGPTISIRKFRRDPFTIVDILNNGTLTTDFAAFLWLIVDGLGVKPANVLFSGGTGSGKTTSLNAATTFVPERERIISIEDTAELQLPHKHWIRMETRPPNVEGRGEITMDDLVKNCLRMRPDRMVVGEVRGPEARTMFTAMNTGHDGCMGTIHANSAMETVSRLTEDPMNVPSIMIPALDLIVMQQRIYHRQKGQIRRVTEVAEVSGLDSSRPQLSRTYKWNPKSDLLEPTGVPSRIKQLIGEFAGISGGDVESEVRRRGQILEWLRAREIRNVFQIGPIIQEYYRRQVPRLQPMHVAKEGESR